VNALNVEEEVRHVKGKVVNNKALVDCVPKEIYKNAEGVCRGSQ
jgi:hypothetical protein